MRKVFLDDLPRWEKEGMGKIGTINWNKSIGCKVKFIYDDIEGEIKIIDYQTKKQKLIIMYNGKIYLDNPILSSSFAKCKLGYYLNKIRNDFKISVNQIIKDDKRDLTIIDRKYNNFNKYKQYKYYKYRCNKCGFDCGEHYKNGEFKEELWVEESNIMGKYIGCSCCSGRTAVLGINTIWDKARWMCDLGVSEEDAKKYTRSSGKKIKVTCPECGNKKNIRISDICNYKSICCSCGDGTSYPEKFMISLLNQLGIEFETQYSPNYLKGEEGERRKFSDFYLPSYKVVVETDG